MELNFLQKKTHNLLIGYSISDATKDVVTVSVDAVLNEGQDYSSEITSFPVESGFNISDHVRREPEMLSLTGFVTDHPINILGLGDDKPSSVLDPKALMSRSWEQYSNLLRLAGYKYTDFKELKNGFASDFAFTDETLLVKIVARYRVYSDMFMQRLRIDADAKTGDALEFVAEFKKVYFTETMRTFNKTSNKTAAPKNTRQAAPKKDNGSVPAEGLDERESILFKGLG